MHDSKGLFFNLDAAKLDYNKNPDGTLNTITATLGSAVWIQTFTYVNGQLTSTSQWEPQ